MRIYFSLQLFIRWYSEHVLVRRRLSCARIMETGAKLEHAPAAISSLSVGTMAKAKKTIDEAKQIQNPELDLVDKNVVSFEEIPGVRK